MEEYGFYPDGLPDIYGEIGEVIAGGKKEEKARMSLSCAII